MRRRRERLQELLFILRETYIEPEQSIVVDAIETQMPALYKELSSLLDEEFLSGYDYALDPTAPLLPRSNQRRALYSEKPKRGPGRPRKNPELPPRPAGRHSDPNENDED